MLLYVLTFVNTVCSSHTAGLPDMAMSALVKEQIEGIRSEAISIIPPDKFAVSHFAVFSKVTASLFFIVSLYDPV